MKRSNCSKRGPAADWRITTTASTLKRKSTLTGEFGRRRGAIDSWRWLVRTRTRSASPRCTCEELNICWSLRAKAREYSPMSSSPDASFPHEKPVVLFTAKAQVKRSSSQEPRARTSDRSWLATAWYRLVQQGVLQLQLVS